jgi:prevent-host-death family protein
MPAAQTINATDFKARCLDILDRLADRTLERVTITKRGRIVGVLLPPDDQPEAIRRLHGFMRGSVVVPEGTDLTAPIADERWNAEDGVLHA